MAALLGATSLLAQVQIPEIAYDSTPNFLKFPDNIYLGEVVGVATNSKGNIFVYTRTGTVTVTEGTAYPYERGSSRLFEFDSRGTFLREIAPGLYGFTFGQNLRVDAQDNVWVVDDGSNMVIKFNPNGRVAMTMGRKPESIRIPFVPAKAGGGEQQGKGAVSDVFRGPTDVAFDSAGNFFVSDGRLNSRIAKFDKNGVFLKSWGWKGKGTGEFDTPQSIATDARGNVYVADMGNKRIQIFDNNGEFKTQFNNIGVPAAICISPGAHQYLFSSNSNDPTTLDNGEIYKMELDGKIVGKFGRAGKILKEFGTVNSIDCRNPNQLYIGEIMNWRVQKLTLRSN
jgi:DNA-binding beta-propeller fold protein YncE